MILSIPSSSDTGPDLTCFTGDKFEIVHLKGQKDFEPTSINTNTDTHMDTHIGMDRQTSWVPSWVSDASCKVIPVYEEWEDYECVDFNALQKARESNN